MRWRTIQGLSSGKVDLLQVGGELAWSRLIVLVNQGVFEATIGFEHVETGG